MNDTWSMLNKKMQDCIKKKATFREGLETLLLLRSSLFETMKQLPCQLDQEAFCAMPYQNAKGYHNKTIAYSLWHIFRIEDIVTHTLILGDEQVFFRENFQRRINSPIITTGNELEKEQIAAFSRQLKLEALYAYMSEVKISTEKMLEELSYTELSRKMADLEEERLRSLAVVSESESAAWLSDYWCHKDVRGLILMPLSRHWIMHTEASLRIMGKLSPKEKIVRL